jgi:hypothetical protein
MLVASGWPRPHLERPKLTELANRDYMKNMVLATKYADAGTQSELMDLTKGSPLLARDVLFMLIAGTAFSATNDEGKPMLPIRYRGIIWRALDQIKAGNGGPTARHPQRWITTPPGEHGTVYTSRGPGELPTWAPA